MQITISECNQYMYLLETEIKNLNTIYRQTNNSELKQYFQNKQQEYFKKWYELNEKLKKIQEGYYTQQKMQEIASYLQVTNWKNL